MFERRSEVSKVVKDRELDRLFLPRRSTAEREDRL